MKPQLIVFFMVLASAWAQLGLIAPKVGLIQDDANVVRPVYGIAGNFVVGDPLASGVISAAFSGKFGLVKTHATLAVIDRSGQTIASMETPRGPALLSFDSSGAPAFAYLTEVGSLLAWDGQTFQTIAIDPETLGTGQVLSVATNAEGQAILLAQRDDGVWALCFSPSDGTLVSQTFIANVAGPVLLLANGTLIYSDPDGVVLRRSDGVPKRIDVQLPELFSFQQMSDNWIEIRAEDMGNSLALRITEGRGQTFPLPGAAQ